MWLTAAKLQDRQIRIETVRHDQPVGFYVKVIDVESGEVIQGVRWLELFIQPDKIITATLSLGATISNVESVSLTAFVDEVVHQDEKSVKES